MPPTMRNDAIADRKDGASQPTNPPMAGYANQYERLFMEEVSLKNERQKILKSEQVRVESSRNSADGERNGVAEGGGNNTDQNGIGELQKIKVRAMLHRASVQGMLLAGQYASEKVSSGQKINNGFEKDLCCKDSRDALSALSTLKMKHLEEDDSHVPNYIGVSSIGWKKQFYSKFRTDSASSGANAPPTLEASADSFFDEYPECRKKFNNLTSHSELNNMEDDCDETDVSKSIDTQKVPQHQKGSRDKPILVPCSSNSPSPERQKDGERSTENKKMAENIQSSPQPPRRNRNQNLRDDVSSMPSMNIDTSSATRKSPPPPQNPFKEDNIKQHISHRASSFSASRDAPSQRSSNHCTSTTDLSRSSSQNNVNNHNQSSTNFGGENSSKPQSPNNPYNRIHSVHHQERQHHNQHLTSGNSYPSNHFHHQARGPQKRQPQNNYQNDHRQDQGVFDYDDYDQNNCKIERVEKQNPFRTAKELGKNFNGNSHGQNRRESNDWDNYEENDSHNFNNKKRRIESRSNYPRETNCPFSETDNDIGSGGSTHGRNGIGQGRVGQGQGPQQLVRAAFRGPKDNLSAGLKKKFQPPIKRDSGRGEQSQGNNSSGGGSKTNSSVNRDAKESGDDDELPEELRGLDKQLIEKINNEIVDSGEQVTFDDIAGLENAKDAVREMVIYPMQRPDLFTGLRGVPKGMLLFGPPGTGKTLIGKAIAHESGATFFSISSSSLTSKWIGEGEKLVRTLFKVAHYRAPSIVFIDEIDSMLTKRKEDENEASRRIKTEFLVQLDGAGNKETGHVLLVGATNRPQELDDAARRRFVKRFYIPLPAQADRETLLRTLLAKNIHSLTDADIIQLSLDTDGFSGADLKSLCSDAAMGPIRKLGKRAMSIDANDIPPISYKHFSRSLRGMSPSVAQADLASYLEWNETYGSKRTIEGDTESDCSDDCSNEIE